MVDHPICTRITHLTRLRALDNKGVWEEFFEATRGASVPQKCAFLPSIVHISGAKIESYQLKQRVIIVN